MNNEHTYVECHHCKWQLEQQPDRDWNKHPCRKCNNTRQIINPEELLCNMCGGCMCHNIKTRSGTWSTNDPHGLFEAQVVGGYESYHLLDLNRYTFSLCEKCLRQLFIQFKIKPTIDEVDFGGGATPESWESDQKFYEYRIWVDSGAHHQAYLDRRCNFIKDCPNKALYTHLINDNFTEDCTCEEHKHLRSGCRNCKFVKFIPNVLKPFL